MFINVFTYIIVYILNYTKYFLKIVLYTGVLS